MTTVKFIMGTNIYYHGSDGHIKQLGDQELQHWKYIKKIGNRYFYTPEELKAYYEEAKVQSNREAAFNKRTAQNDRQERDDFRKDVHNDFREQAKDMQVLYRDKNDNLRVRDQTKKEKAQRVKAEDKRYKREVRVNKFIDRLSDAKREAKKKVDPIAKTAKMASKGKEQPKTTQPKHSQEDIDRIKRESWAREVKRKDALRKKKKKEAAHRQYSPASRW